RTCPRSQQRTTWPQYHRKCRGPWPGSDGTLFERQKSSADRTIQQTSPARTAGTARRHRQRCVLPRGSRRCVGQWPSSARQWRLCLNTTLPIAASPMGHVKQIRHRNRRGDIEAVERLVRERMIMQYKTLGNTGLLVSRLCFGTMTFGGGEGLFKMIGAVDQKGADQLIQVAFEDGVNFFDPADVYSDGESEKTLGQSFKNLNIPRKEVVIATKVYGRIGPGCNDVGASRGHIMDAVEASLRRLQTDHIDLYQIHANDFVTPV